MFERTRSAPGPGGCVLALALLLACEGPAVPSTSSELRVISLAPSITRTVQTLGASDVLVAVDEYSLRSLALDGVPSVGGLYQPDLERTLELEPTLVLAITTAQQRDYLFALAERGVRVESIDPYTLEEHLTSIERIGGWVDREAEAEDLVRELRSGLAALRSADASRRGPSVAIVVEREPIYVVGRGSFVHELLEVAGGRNVFADLSDPFPPVSLESLVARAPDVLIDATAAARSQDTHTEARDFWSRYLHRTRIELLDDASVTLPGPHFLQSALRLRELVVPGDADPDPHARPTVAAP